MSNKLIILIASLYGLLLKILCYLRVVRPSCGLNKELRDRQIVVSLTSYGRRVDKIVGYTIISLLRQSYKPDEIILWLDSDNWNENNIPRCLKKLMANGLTILFCEDIRSYKKLIPTLKIRPNSLIVTTDDDIFYRKDTIERLVNQYKENPNKIYCHTAHGVTLDMNNAIASYKEWIEDMNGSSGPFVFPVGEGCVLYDPVLLYKDVAKAELFLKLAPYADDVWFYFMEALNGTECCQLKSLHSVPYMPLDMFYQHFHKGSSLRHSNVSENLNDKQIRSIIDYYSIKFDAKGKILSHI
jgi:hypothetical protein